MSECPRDDMRDRLPDLLSERLDAVERAEVARHVAACSECAAELELLRSMRTALEPAPRVDVGRIAARVAASRWGVASTPDLSPVAAHRASPPNRRIVWQIAAGMVVAAAGLGTWAVTHRQPTPTYAVIDSAPAHTPDSAPPAPNAAVKATATPHHAAPTTSQTLPNASQTLAGAGRHGLVMDGGVGDLSDGDMKMLLQSLDSLTAIPDADPASVSYQIDDDGGVQ